MNTKAKVFGGIAIVAIILVIVFLFLRKPDENFTQNQQNSTNTEKITEDKKNVAPKKNKKIVYKKYTNQEFNIQLPYPENYTLKEGVMGTVVYFLSEKDGLTDLFQENFNIVVQDFSAQPMTLEEFTDLSLGHVSSLITDAQILSSQKTTLAGKPAYEVIYTGKQGQYNLKWKQKWALVGNTAYVLTYTAEIDQFDQYLKIFNHMFDSFKIVK